MSLGFSFAAGGPVAGGPVSGDILQMPTYTLTIGGDPYIHKGKENSSTGYSWTVEVADENVVRCCKWTGRYPKGICGASADFMYYFHAVGMGETIVNLYHARSWEGDGKGGGPTNTFTLKVDATKSVVEIEAALAAATAELAEARTTLAAANVEPPPPPPPTGATVRFPLLIDAACARSYV